MNRYSQYLVRYLIIPYNTYILILLIMIQDYISFMMDSILSPLNNPDIDDDLPNDIYYDHIVQLTIDEICDLVSLCV